MASQEPTSSFTQRSQGLTTKERRATPRMPVELNWEEIDGSSRYFRATCDLSTFGMATRQGLVHAHGDHLKLALHLPDELLPIELQAKVVGSYDARGGMRLAFQNAPVEALRRIHGYLRTRLMPE
jgi:hypothetical protein